MLSITGPTQHRQICQPVCFSPLHTHMISLFLLPLVKTSLVSKRLRERAQVSLCNVHFEDIGGGTKTLSLSLRRLAVSTNTTSTNKKTCLSSYKRIQTIPYCSRWGQGSSRHWPWRRFQELSGEWEYGARRKKRQIIQIEYKKQNERTKKSKEERLDAVS